MGYTEKEIKELCEGALQNIELFYTQKFVNYAGKTTDNCKWYTEVVAEFVLEHLTEFQNIKSIEREQSYNQKHDGQYDENSNREEELDAMKMFNQKDVGAAGEIIDYQIPLKGKRSDKAGKIDLLSQNNEAVYVLELKKEDSIETLLRCVLEGYTYKKTVMRKKLYKEYKLDDNLPLRTAPFVYEGGRQWLEYIDLENRPKLKELMEKLDEGYIITPFFITKKILYNSKTVE